MKVRKNTLKLLKLLFTNEYSDLAEISKAMGNNSDMRFMRSGVKKLIKRHNKLISMKEGKYFPTDLCLNTVLNDKTYIKDEETGELKELHKIEYNAFLERTPHLEMLMWFAKEKYKLRTYKYLGKNKSILYLVDAVNGYSVRIFKSNRCIFHLLDKPQGNNTKELILHGKKEITKCVESFEKRFKSKLLKDEGQYILPLQDSHLAWINHPFTIWLSDNNIKIVVKSDNGTYTDIGMDKSKGVLHLECENKDQIEHVDDVISSHFKDVNNNFSMSENHKKIINLKQDVISLDLSVRDFVKNETIIMRTIVDEVKELSRFKTESLDRSEDMIKAINVNSQQNNHSAILFKSLMSEIKIIKDKINIR